jgi:hypothetical protein
MDFANNYRLKQITVWLLVGVTACLANLPKEWAAHLNLQVEYLLGVFGLLIVLALFLFTRFSYFLLTVLLIIGANLPDRWSHSLAIDKVPLITALCLMIVGSLLNQFVKILPSGLEPKAKVNNPEGIRALMSAIQRGQARSVQIIISMNIDLDVFDESGRTPLMAAAAAGQSAIVDMLSAAGAKIDLKTPDGLSAIDLATQSGHLAITAQLQDALARISAQPAQAAA